MVEIRLHGSAGGGCEEKDQYVVLETHEGTQVSTICHKKGCNSGMSQDKFPDSYHFWKLHGRLGIH